MKPPLPRLNDRTLGEARGRVQLPSYDRKRLSAGIVHLGLGNFARAHLAEYTEDAIEAANPDWGIIGVSLQRPDQRDRLAPQDGLYTTLQRDGSDVRARIIGCVSEVLVAPEDPAAVIRAMVSPACRIVSLTVTEKGYCFDAASGRLDTGRPAIRQDLRDPANPRSVFGFLAAALRLRRATKISPFTVLCCDNLADNGRRVAHLLDQFVRGQDQDLADWIAKEGAFPSTMVDRIVPATTDADLAAASAATGLADLAPVSHEPFRQWVIEDRFVGGVRPSWEQAGAQFTTDVGAYERLKLRMLNAAHSALAYLGCLAGERLISEAAGDQVFRRFVFDLWREEIIPEVRAPDGVDPFQYADALMKRFDNRAILHRTSQVGSDGSQKLPVRVLSTIRECLEQGKPIARLAHVIAAWIGYLGGVDAKGQAIEVGDPLRETLQAALAAAGDNAEARVAAVVGFEPIFGADLSGNRSFRRAVLDAYVSIVDRGVHQATSLLADAGSIKT